MKDNSVIAVFDEYNHKIFPPQICPCIQAKYPVPNHGPRIIEKRHEPKSKDEKTRCLIAFEIPKTLMKAQEQRRRVYYTNGLCPTILTNSGGYFETKILEER